MRMLADKTPLRRHVALKLSISASIWPLTLCLRALLRLQRSWYRV